MAQIQQFSGLGMYDKGGKFEPTEENINAAKAKALEEGKKYIGDATTFETFKDRLFDTPDATIALVSGTAETLSEFVLGLAKATLQGAQMATTTDPKRVEEIRKEPGFTSYFDQLNFPRTDIYDSKISGVTPTDLAEFTGKYIAPLPGAPLVAGAKIATTPVLKGIGQLSDDIIKSFTKGDSGFRTSAGGVRTVDDIIEEGVKKPKIQGKVLEYMKSMDPNDILKMTDDELLDLLESKLGFRTTANTIYRSKKKLGITTERGKKLTQRSGGALTKPLEEMISEGITKNMTLPEIQQYLKNKYNVDATTTALSQRLGAGNFKPLKNINSSEIVKNALLNLDSLENVTMDQIKNIPEIKKMNLTDAALDTAISNARKTPGLEDFKIVKAKPKSVIEKLFSEGTLNKKKFDTYLENNPSVTTAKLLEQFPILKNYSIQSILKYRRDKGLSTRQNPDPDKSIQTRTNPDLDKRLEYVRNIESLYGDTIDNKTIKVIKAHALGEGKIIDLNPKDIVALEKKIKYIPSKFLDEVKSPSFFLTSSGNDAHRVIENNLINTLVDKYQKLGYKFVDNAEMPWKKPSKEIDLSLSKNKELANEIKALNKKIDGFKDDLFKMDAFTLFYNPIKGKMISYGKPASEVPGLANIVTKIKKGDLKLRDGGIVGISHLTRPL